jgi:hypothetical protein
VPPKSSSAINGAIEFWSRYCKLPKLVPPKELSSAISALGAAALARIAKASARRRYRQLDLPIGYQQHRRQSWRWQDARRPTQLQEHLERREAQFFVPRELQRPASCSNVWWGSIAVFLWVYHTFLDLKARQTDRSLTARSRTSPAVNRTPFRSSHRLLLTIDGIINHDLFLSNAEVRRVIRRSIDAAAA